MDTTAYDKHLPCLNPHCKSHGKPHPNCRCYAMSSGGEVSRFCNTQNPHKDDCEYYMASGGEIDPSQVVVDEPKEEPVIDPKLVVPDEEIDPDQVQVDPEPQAAEKPTNYIEQVKAGAEGLAQGIGTDLVKNIESGLGISSKEAIEQREKDYPATHMISKGVGFAASLEAGPAKWAAAKLGSGILKKLVGNLVIAGAYKGADEVSKSLSGTGDPQDSVASSLLDVGIDGLLYTATDGLFSASKSAKFLQDAKWVKRAEDLMIGLAEKPVTTGISAAAAHYFPEAARHIPGDLGKMFIGSDPGFFAELAETGAVKKFLGPYIEKILGKPLTKANQYVGDAILNTLIKTDYMHVPAAIRFGQRVAAGASKFNPWLDGALKSGSKLIKHEVASELEKEKINSWIEDGGTDKELQMDNAQEEMPQYAEGGVIAPKQQSFAMAYPEQNIALNQIRGRAYKYLNSIRPLPNSPKMPFDSHTEQKDQKREYSKALGYAARPLSILNKVDDGTLTPSDIKHFTQMFPEVYGHISKGLTKKIIEAQEKGEKPPYGKRQALSLFLGANLDSTFTPIAIQTIQGLYAMNRPQAQQQQAGKPKKSTAPLSKLAPSSLTGEQARTQRQQNSKA